MIHLTYVTHILKLFLYKEKWFIDNFFFFYDFVYKYIKMVNRYYQNNKEKFQKKHGKGTKIIMKKHKKKSVSIIRIEIKIFLKEKSKGKLSM